MATTTLYLRETTGNGIGSFRDMLAQRGSSSFKDGAVDTVASGTQIQWTKTQGGAVLEWISGRVPSGGFTLSGTMTFNIWPLESDMNANAGGRSRVYKRTAGGSESEIAGGPWDDGVEFSSSGAAVRNWTGTPSSGVSFAEDDRIIVRYYITNVGTMGGGYYCTLSYDGGFAGVQGDSYLTINEGVTFKAESSNVTVALTGVAAAAAVGILGVALSLGLSGVFGTGSVGSVGIGAALSGVSATGAVGALTTAAETRLVSSVLGEAQAFGGLTTEIRLASSVLGTATSSAPLTSAIRLASSVVGAASTTASLTNKIRLVAAVSGQAQASGDLTTGISLASSVNAVATSSAALTNEIRFSGTLVGTGTATGSLSTQIGLSSQVTGQATSNASLSTSIPLQSSVTGQASAVGHLTTNPEIRLVSSVLGEVQAFGGLTTGIPLKASVSATATSGGALTTGILFQSSVVGGAVAEGNLTVGVQAALLKSSVIGAASTTASLTTSIPLASNVYGQADVVSGLSTGIRLQSSVFGQADCSGLLTVAPEQSLFQANVVGTASVVGALTTQILFAVDCYTTSYALARFPRKRGPIRIGVKRSLRRFSVRL